MEEITKRIALILEYYNLNGAAFADKIGVQRSGLSHILSGRNKPSLDFIIKITEAFSEVDVNWLLHGKGQFPSTPKVASKDEKESTVAPQPVVAPSMNIDKKDEVPALVKNQQDSEISKIMIFYTDGTFSEFKPRG